MSENGGFFPDVADCLDGPAVVAFWGSEEPGGERAMGSRELDWHSHLRGQLFSVETGLVRIRTEVGSWILPPHRVGWVPPGEMHEVSISGTLSGWGAMLSPVVCDGLPTRACVMAASELLRALVRKAVSFADATTLTPEQERLAAVLIDEIRVAPMEPLHLPMPSDSRLLRLAMHLLAHPQDDRPLPALATEAFVSERTARRLFLAETGMTFLQWRQQARLTLAFERLARGEAVADVSDGLGYATPSNFIAMFRRAFGSPPARYFARLGGPRGSVVIPSGIAV
jgi:AraC-like DNA-binding protein